MLVDVAFTLGDVPRPFPDGVHAVVVDVVRAMTVTAHALSNGADGVRPVADLGAAREAAASSGALLGGERGGLPLAGFDLGNSPGDYDRARCDGRPVVLTTSNGTRAVAAVAGAASVWGAALVNAEATVRGLLAERGAEAGDGAPRPDDTLRPGDVLVVCAGSGDRPAADDLAAAGCLAGSFALRGAAAGTDATRAAVALFDAWKHDLIGLLRRSLSGRKLATIGLAGDLDVCAVVDTAPVAARLDERGVFRAVPASR